MEAPGDESKAWEKAMNLKFLVRCMRCGDDHEVGDTSFDDYGPELILRVEPCSKCLREAREQIAEAVRQAL